MREILSPAHPPCQHHQYGVHSKVAPLFVSMPSAQSLFVGMPSALPLYVTVLPISDPLSKLNYHAWVVSPSCDL